MSPALQINLADMVHDVRLDLLQHGAGGADAVQRAAVERGEMLQHGGPHCDAAILIAAQQASGEQGEGGLRLGLGGCG